MNFTKIFFITMILGTFSVNSIAKHGGNGGGTMSIQKPSSDPKPSTSSASSILI